MACAQIGSGKTAAFLLPILDWIIETRADACVGAATQSPQAVIISPTRELEARKFSSGSAAKIGILYGGTDSEHQARQLARGCNVLVATPGRLLDFAERGQVSFASVQFLVLDEADRMLDMGFMPNVHRCVYNRTMPLKGIRQTLMFSATFPPAIRETAEEFLSNYLFLQVIHLLMFRGLFLQVGLVDGA
jgi:superfamily II DNA/RNA helicase